MLKIKIKDNSVRPSVSVACGLKVVVWLFISVDGSEAPNKSIFLGGRIDFWKALPTLGVDPAHWEDLVGGICV